MCLRRRLWRPKQHSGGAGAEERREKLKCFVRPLGVDEVVQDGLSVHWWANKHLFDISVAIGEHSGGSLVRVSPYILMSHSPL